MLLFKIMTYLCRLSLNTEHTDYSELTIYNLRIGQFDTDEITTVIIFAPSDSPIISSVCYFFILKALLYVRI